MDASASRSHSGTVDAGTNRFADKLVSMGYPSKCYELPEELSRSVNSKQRATRKASLRLLRTRYLLPIPIDPLLLSEPTALAFPEPRGSKGDRVAHEK